jgi:3-oxoacyl-[acyl-carrier protein] reductase
MLICSFFTHGHSRSDTEPEIRIQKGLKIWFPDKGHSGRTSLSLKLPDAADRQQPATKEEVMNQRVALVTGASRGIGRAIALSLAKDGIMVAVHYNKQRSAAEEVVFEIGRSGGAAFALQADIAEVASITALYTSFDAELKKRTGEAKFDILVNNAAIGEAGTIESTSVELFDQLFAVNARGPFFMIQNALPRLRDFGRIINISSCVTRLAFPDVAAYSATKGAINVLTVLLASQLGERGITVNAVAPGATETDMNTRWLNNAEERRKVKNKTAMGRVGKPQDIAGLVSYLASQNSAWVTGQYIEASGGIGL